MKPTTFIKASEPPTIFNLAMRGMSAGLDRFVGVQPAHEQVPQGVAVFLMTRKAIREVAPFLESHIRTLPQRQMNPNEFLTSTPETTLPQIFSALRYLGHQWAYIDLPTSTGESGLLTIILGDSVNDAFAAELTKRGAICNLK